MLAEYKHALRRWRGQIIGWSVGLGLYSLLMVSFFDTIVAMPEYEELLANFPPEMMAFFSNIYAITTPAGYLDTYFFSYANIIVGIFVIGAAVGMLVGEEERGVLDLTLAHPISRAKLFAARTLALVTATTIILLVNWLSWAVPGRQTQMNLTWLEFLWPFIPLLAQLLLFGALALLLSFVLPSARMASMLTGGLMVGNFLLMGMSRLNEDLEPIAKLTPFYYYQGGLAVNGIEWDRLVGITGVALLFTAVAWFLFRERDIRVGGEGSWKFFKFS
jgi:ABC-2 type transport system permease protein